MTDVNSVLLAEAAIQKAIQTKSTRVWNGTVVAYDAGSNVTKVILDGDADAIDAVTAGHFQPGPGDRVLVLLAPPSAAYVIGTMTTTPVVEAPPNTSGGSGVFDTITVGGVLVSAALPPSPTGLVAVPGSFSDQSYVDVSWIANGSPEYQIELARKTSGVYQVAEQTTTPAAQIRFEGLTAGAGYGVRVCGLNHLGNAGAFGSYVDFTAGRDTVAPPQIAPLSLSRASTSIMVSWPASTADDVINGKGLYLVELSSNNFTSTMRADLEGGTVHTFNALLAEQTYYVRVAAIDSSGNIGPYSDIASITAGGVNATMILPDSIGPSQLAAGAVTPAKVGFIVGGGNLLSNSGFENPTTPLNLWSLNAGGSVTIVTGRSGSGSAAQFDATSFGTDLQQTVTLPPGSYTVSAWIKTANLTSNGYGLNVYSGGTIASALTAGTSMTTGWTRRSVSFTLSVQSNVTIFLQNRQSGSPTGTATFDDIQLEAGDLLTSYAPRPDEILPNAVGSVQLATDAVTSAKIAANAITTAKVAANAIDTAQLANSAVTAAQLASASVTAAALAAGAVTAPAILAGAVIAGKIAVDAVTAGTIASGAVTAGKIAAGAVTAGTVAAGAVTAGTIAAGAVTATEIAANTITASKIAADTITSTEIAANAITTSELAANAVTAAKITANTITATQIAANTITATQIAANTITATQIAADTITANEIAANAITTTELAANSVTAGKVAANAITATNIAAGAVTTDKLTVAALGANRIVNGNFEGTTYTSGAHTIPEGWGGVSGTGPISLAAGVNGVGLAMRLDNSGGGGIYVLGRRFPVVAGDVYAWSCRYKSSATVASGLNLTVGVYSSSTEYSRTGALEETSVLNNVGGSAGVWNYAEGKVTISNSGYLAVWPSVSSTTLLDIDDVVLKKVETSVTIADGAISAVNIAADAVTSTKILAGSIQTSHMTAGTINGDRITANTLDVAKLTASTLTSKTITIGAGGQFQVGSTPGAGTAGLIINSQGISVYNSSSRTIYLDATTGAGTFTGTVNATSGSFSGSISSTANITASGGSIKTTDIFGGYVELSNGTLFLNPGSYTASSPATLHAIGTASNTGYLHIVPHTPTAGSSTSRMDMWAGGTTRIDVYTPGEAFHCLDDLQVDGNLISFSAAGITIRPSGGYADVRIPLFGTSGDVPVTRSATSGELFYQVSSERFKSEITPLEATYNLNLIDEIEPISFLSKTKDGGHKPHRFVGLSAERTFTVAPFLVALDQNSDPISVLYDQVGVLAFAGVRDLRSRVAALEAELLTLKSNKSRRIQ